MQAIKLFDIGEEKNITAEQINKIIGKAFSKEKLTETEIKKIEAEIRALLTPPITIGEADYEKYITDLLLSPCFGSRGTHSKRIEIAGNKFNIQVEGLDLNDKERDLIVAIYSIVKSLPTSEKQQRITNETPLCIPAEKITQLLGKHENRGAEEKNEWKRTFEKVATRRIRITLENVPITTKAIEIKKRYKKLIDKTIYFLQADFNHATNCAEITHKPLLFEIADYYMEVPLKYYEEHKTDELFKTSKGKLLSKAVFSAICRNIDYWSKEQITYNVLYSYYDSSRTYEELTPKEKQNFRIDVWDNIDVWKRITTTEDYKCYPWLYLLLLKNCVEPYYQGRKAAGLEFTKDKKYFALRKGKETKDIPKKKRGKKQ